MNKRWLALTLAWALALGLCACGNEMESPAPSQESTEAVLELRDITPEEWEAELYVCTVPGEETDYEEIARQLTEQYAQALRARPQNLRQSVLDAQPMPQEELVYDAYYGEEAPNFCFILSLSLDLAEERVADWMVGSGLEYPDFKEDYPIFSREALAEKGEDGNWHLTNIGTGGYYVRLPVSFGHPDDHPSVEEMLDIWFLTEGETRDWRIFSALDAGGYTADEVKAAMDKYPEEKQNVLLDGVRAYMKGFRSDYTWTPEDWGLTETEVERFRAKHICEEFMAGETYMLSGEDFSTLLNSGWTIEHLEYTYLDVDGDGVEELLLQWEGNAPHDYNGVFHYDNGQLKCWQHDMIEASCRDYPLTDGTMVRQYDMSGNPSYTIFRYDDEGNEIRLGTLTAREYDLWTGELDPRYTVDEKEVDKATFDAALAQRITDKLLPRTAWSPVKGK